MVFEHLDKALSDNAGSTENSYRDLGLHKILACIKEMIEILQHRMRWAGRNRGKTKHWRLTLISGAPTGV